MGTATLILEKLDALGITVRVIEPDRIGLQPASRIPADLMTQLRAAKPEILAALKSGVIRPQRPVTCAASCYEIEPGRWIHHPWDGCRTVPKAWLQ